jgi:hypothetical protein
VFLKENPLCIDCLEERSLDPGLSKVFGSFLSGAYSDETSFEELRGIVKLAPQIQATVVDHIVPHRGNMRLFWARENWAARCKPHHDAKTAREDGGFGQ